MTLARGAGVPVLLDASGPALVAGVAAGPDVIKPNADELLAATGEADPLRAVARLVRDARGGTVVASFGPDGMLAGTDGVWWRARPPGSVHGNATGAGDAAVAALARGSPRAPLAGPAARRGRPVGGGGGGAGRG